MQDPRKLRVSGRSKKLAVATRKATADFPSGYSDMKNQIHRAVESIPFNIGEGCGADTQAEFARFLGISIKSAFELAEQLDLAHDYRILGEEKYESLSQEVVVVRKMLFKLRRRVQGDRDDVG